MSGAHLVTRDDLLVSESQLVRSPPAHLTSAYEVIYSQDAGTGRGCLWGLLSCTLCVFSTLRTKSASLGGGVSGKQVHLRKEPL